MNIKNIKSKSFSKNFDEHQKKIDELNKKYNEDDKMFRDTMRKDYDRQSKRNVAIANEKKVMPVTVAGFSIVPKKQYDIMVLSHKEPEGTVDDDSGITFGKWQRYDGKDAIKVLQHVEFGLNKGMLEVAVDEVK